MWQKFPPRAVAAQLAGHPGRPRRSGVRGDGLPYAAAENDQSRYSRRLGVIRMLDWLEAQPGSTWQDRWHAGCRSAADQDWRDTAER